MLGHYFKVVWRELLKYRTESVIRILGITIGFMAFVFGGYWWYWENRFDGFHPNQDRLFAVITYGLVEDPRGGEAGLNQLHQTDGAYFATYVPEIEKMCPVQDGRIQVESQGNMQTYSFLGVDSVFFQLFYHRFLDGGYHGIVPDKKSVILTRRIAKRFFGTVNCSGQRIVFGKDRSGWDQEYYVAGVVEDYPTNSVLEFDFLLYGSPEYNSMNRTMTYFLLKENIDIRRVMESVAGYKSKAVDPYGIDLPSLWRFELCPMTDIHLKCSPQLDSRFRNIRMLALAGLLAFVGALMNHLVLFIGQQQRKSREYLTRVSLGTSPWKLGGKMLIELLFPLLLAFVLSACLIEVLFPWYQEYTMIREEGILTGFVQQMEKSGMWLGVLKFMGISILLFMIFSMIPIGFILKQEYRKISNRENQVSTPLFFRRMLIVGQIFIGSLFFIASWGMFRQLYFLTHKDMGIDLNRVVQVGMGFSTSDAIDKDQLRAELKSCPFVEEMTMTNEPILSPHGIYYGNEVGYVSVQGRDRKKFKEEGDEDYLFNIEENFFGFFRIPLKEGTYITAGNPGDVVVNETGARELGFPDLLQRHLESDPASKVCGIIRDYHYAPLQFPIRKVFFRVEREKMPFSLYHYFYVRYTPQHREQVWSHIREVMKKYNRGEVAEDRQLIEMSSVIEEFNRPEVMIFTLFSILAALCILISTFGIYSLVSLSAEQRKKEIAVRKVNGAMFVNILGLFFREYLLLVLIGCTLALLLGYRLVQSWLETYASHATLNVWMFIGVFFITTVIVLVSIACQVRQAVRHHPSEALKEG